MSSIVDAFANTLDTVNRPTAFCAAGAEQMPSPGLNVEGVGPIALPLLPMQAEQLIAAAERAPYGRGQDTITDIAVRRTWQIDAARISIVGKHWAQTLRTIVEKVAETLGIANPIDAELYKLLIYDQGSFFVPHRDTEKAPGMFATLVLALPSVSQGGALIVRHKDQELRLDLQCNDPSEVAFAAFYADCVHEVLPVTAGHRLVLVYNLLRRGPGRLPSVADYDDEQDTLTTLLKRWASDLRASDRRASDRRASDRRTSDGRDSDGRDPGDTEPLKLIYPLEHAYTQAELGFGSLKGADTGLAQVVVAAARRAGCDVHLALISVEENGIAQQTGRYSRYSDADDEAFEIVEMNDRSAVASSWRRVDGAPSPLTEIPIFEGEFSPPLSFDELEPDEEHFHEATGNDGASYDRTYSRSALILWPSDQILAVIDQAGLSVTLPFLQDLTDRWIAEGDADARDQAYELSEHMLSGWQFDRWYPSHDDTRSEVGQFLGQLVRLRDSAKIDRFLTALATRGGFDTADAADVADALNSLPQVRAADLAKALIQGAADSALSACGKLLVHFAALDANSAAAGARLLVAALPGDPAREPETIPWRRGPGINPTFIIDLLTALGRIDAMLAAIAVDDMLAWPATYDFDTVLLPAMHTLLNTAETNGQAAVQRLRAACLNHLDTRIALKLEAPADWQRDDPVSCTCADCRALSVFLRDATQKTWVFAAAQPRRSHVENTIRYKRPDVNTATEKRGSPHRLICTKNQASYERRCQQRVNDLMERAFLTK